ncbi:hypothetical protein [Bombiscardovia coagulans]|uniref:Uncharacterized protein n=1 Tax=Bombiscardovia coagulans TaxID=686666 RepID=A0A261ET91_9BIFI|nr:hypothetical protein [Bombiscardovia coagulans]OZG50071.1 hypothetical protein BOCO_0588 [Bombiscardovia coagulans]
MSQNLTLSNGGIVKKGYYGHIDAHGDVFMEPGVQFQTLRIYGNTTASTFRGSSLTVNGNLRLVGQMNVVTIQGQGGITGSCSLFANNVDFRGLIQTKGSIHVKHSFNFSGLITGQQLMVARNVNINGVADFEHLIAHHVYIRSLHPKVVPLKHVKWMVRPSKITTISCYQAELHKCGCRFIQANTIDLREGSFIYDAACIGSISTDKSSAAVMTLGGAKRLHVAGY